MPSETPPTAPVEIVSRWDRAKVLFRAELDASIPLWERIRAALEIAVCDRADLVGANLGGANLGAANLVGANLGGANLGAANLGGAKLVGANLNGANLNGANLGAANLGGANLGAANLGGAKLVGANLVGANLGGANLVGANLVGANLVGERPIFMVGPIGSRSDYLTAYATGTGICIRAGCFFGTVDEFRDALAKKHGDNQHATEYLAALVLIEAHAAIWAPVAAEIV